MSDIIKVLPDTLANQIAACEVVERPASVIKELIENSIDAGASEITVIIKDGGKNLIQIIDNGIGMSHTDARMCFERHATSKISTIEDLFRIKTMGFRGEALASIAGIAQVELKTKTQDEELGTVVRIEGGKVEAHDFVSMEKGTNFAVKNLFYNIPARKNAMKNRTTEYKYILGVFKRAAFSHPSIKFKLVNEDNTQFDLPSVLFKQRFIDLFGISYVSKVIKVEEEASFFSIRGFVGKPELAKKYMGEQFLYVNERPVRDSAIHHAVASAFDMMIETGKQPSYFLFIDIAPQHIDVNVDPHKKQIRFFRGKEVYNIVQSIVRSALGKFHLDNPLNLDADPLYQKAMDEVLEKTKQQESVRIPSSASANQTQAPSSIGTDAPHSFITKKNNRTHWESLLEIVDDKNEDAQKALFVQHEEQATFEEDKQFLCVQNTFILAKIRSGVCAIHIPYAEQRIHFETLKKNVHKEEKEIQKLLMPETYVFSKHEWALIEEDIEKLNDIGFELRPIGDCSVIVDGIPTIFAGYNVEKLLTAFKDYFLSDELSGLDVKTKLLASMCVGTRSNFEYKDINQVKSLVDKLFSCENPNFTPTGKKIITFITTKTLEELFLT